MPDINVLIKPASGMCNLRCKYCFYHDETKKREVESYGFMTEETLENIIKKTIIHSEKTCTFAFQGGEPTLIGLPFFIKAMELQKKHNNKGLIIQNAIQTNGIGLGEDFIRFFKENNFLVGISLDGTREIHDIFRVDAKGRKTYNAVWNTIEMFHQYGVEYNVLTVVHSQTARYIQRIYEFYKENKISYMQFIPCLNPIGEEGVKYPHSLTVKAYTKYLKTLFDLWYEDIKKENYVHIQQFENYILMLLGHPPDICGMSGICTHQNVVEADGEVYPCDFYVLDSYKLGNLNTVSFDEINERRLEIKFIETSIEKPSDCMECKYIALCRGGCRRYREPFIDGSYQKNYLCKAYNEFFEYSIERLQELARYYYRK